MPGSFFKGVARCGEAAVVGVVGEMEFLGGCFEGNEAIEGVIGVVGVALLGGIAVGVVVKFLGELIEGVKGVGGGIFLVAVIEGVVSIGVGIFRGELVEVIIGVGAEFILELCV